MNTKIRIAIALCLSLMTIGCGGGSMNTTGTTGTPPSQGIDLTVNNITKGPFSVAMSTSFQPAEWDYQFFANYPSATTPLNNLSSQHIRLQPVSQGVPEKADHSWDFSTLNAVLNPVIGVADKSPELQLATAPAWMDDSGGSLLPAHFSDFAAYSADMVAYYNTTTGFQDANGNTHSRTPVTPITYWGIFNEPNFNNIDSTEYTLLYNMTVPAMRAIDPTIKFAAVELGDYDGLAATYLPAFVNNVSAQVDVLATHFYSTCNQIDSDSKVFSTIPGFVSEVKTIYSLMGTNSMLVNVPVWVTENNVNADYDKGGGISACNGNKFVTDPRGSSAFFAAWRPYVFSQLGKAGVRTLYHWSFDGDKQFGEFNDSSGNLQLSYWVDYWLARMFPATAGSNLLDFTSGDNSDIEVLPVRNADGSVVVMVADYAVANASDNNGRGVARTLIVNVNALGSFSSASLLTIDTNTNSSTGPTAESVAPTSPITITLGGYGVAFLKLVP
ncbi:MAG: glycosyl hydrolase [Terriglobales bacterium]